MMSSPPEQKPPFRLLVRNKPPPVLPVPPPKLEVPPPEGVLLGRLGASARLEGVEPLRRL